MNSFLVVLAIFAVFIVRGVVAEKKRAEEAQRKAAAQRAAGQSSARPSGPVARPAAEWDAYGNPVRPPARPAAAQRPAPPSPARPAAQRPAEPASGSIAYTSPEGVGSQEGMGSQEGTSAYAPPPLKVPSVVSAQPAHHLRYALNRTTARRALIYGEILGKPKALRR